MNYKKIAIVGPRGSGKTTISDQLSRELSIPVFHMDEIMWSPKWESVCKEEYLRIHNQIIGGEQWIIDGSIDEDMKERLTAADLVIYIDYPVIISSFRFFKRYVSRCWNMMLMNGKQIPEEPLFTCLRKMLNQIIYRYENKRILTIINNSNIKKLLKLKYFKQDALISESFTIA